MDLEGYARILLKKGKKRKLAELIAEVKNIPIDKAEKIAEAVFLEVKNAYSKTTPILDYFKSDVKMGEFGVGSRGEGDFYVHSKIGEMCRSELDDAGVVRVGDYYLAISVDGIHSRLSEFPFIAGFHAARAAMRDVYVMGAKPVALLSDIHVADDGDVAKIFDHLAGIMAISEATKVPLVSGSTLRIGGDMVIGERMTGAVGCVGVGKKVTRRRNAKPGDVILMTEGAGGGTIATTAIYYGKHEIVEETINIDFIKAAEVALKHVEKIHAMTDVTNGGIRGDAMEISRVSKTKLVFDYEKLRSVVNKKVLDMLEELEIDFLGVSIDSLMIICPENVANEIADGIEKGGVRVEEVGRVEEGEGAYLIEDGTEKELKPRFRESAYTPIKKLVGEDKPENFEEMKRKIDEAFEAALRKKELVLKKLRKIPS